MCPLGGWTTINVQSAVVVPTTILESSMSEAPRSSMSSGPLLTTAASGDMSTNAHGYTVTSASRRPTSSTDDVTEKFNDIAIETNDEETWVNNLRTLSYTSFMVHFHMVQKLM